MCVGFCDQILCYMAATGILVALRFDPHTASALGVAEGVLLRSWLPLRSWMLCGATLSLHMPAMDARHSTTRARPWAFLPRREVITEPHARARPWAILQGRDLSTEAHVRAHLWAAGRQRKQRAARMAAQASPNQPSPDTEMERSCVYMMHDVPVSGPCCE